MRIIFAFVFLIGIGIAGFAVYMAMERFNQYQAENAELRARAGSAVEMVDVVLATEELRYGQELKRAHARVTKFPKDAVPENSFTSLVDLFGEEGSETPPRAIVRTMEPGEIIMATKVTRFGQEAGVASRLNAGMRAFTIKVDVTTGVSGFLQPGDRVDVYWSGSQGIKQVTKLLLEDIELIAVDQIADEDANRPVVARTVTVEVTPVVVATLAQAQSTGRLSLSLRGAEEDEILGPLEVTQESLLGIKETVEVEEEKVCTTRVRRGVEFVETVVPCPE